MYVWVQNSLTAIAMATCFVAGFTDADDRAPQGVAAGIEKPLRIAPRPGNGRNSEGDFIQLKDGRLMLIYTKFVGKSDHATAELVSRYSADQGLTWSSDDVQVVAREEGQANLMSVSLLRLRNGRIALFYIQKYTSPVEAKYPFLDHLLMRTSDDDGRTWSKPTHVSPRDKPAYRVLNNDRVIQLKSGRLVVPVATHYQPGWSGWRNSAQIHCYLSDDNGITWRSSGSILESELLAQEPGVVELKDRARDDGLPQPGLPIDVSFRRWWRDVVRIETFRILLSRRRHRRPSNGSRQQAIFCWFGTMATILCRRSSP